MIRLDNVSASLLLKLDSSISFNLIVWLRFMTTYFDCYDIETCLSGLTEDQMVKIKMLPLGCEVTFAFYVRLDVGWKMGCPKRLFRKKKKMFYKVQTLWKKVMNMVSIFTKVMPSLWGLNQHIETKFPTHASNLSFSIQIDEAVNLTSESHNSIARMNYLRKRKKEKT